MPEGYNVKQAKALPPGARLEDEVSLTLLRLGDHYSLPRERNPVMTRHGAVTVQCEVGWGYTPILPRQEEQSVRNINGARKPRRPTLNMSAFPRRAVRNWI